MSTSQGRQVIAAATKSFSRRGWSCSPPRQPPVAPTSESGLPLTNLPYFVHRTPSQQLPIYTDAKSGGTRKLTLLRKTDGNISALEEHLAKELGVPLKGKEIQSNRLNGNIVVKVGSIAGYRCRSCYSVSRLSIAISFLLYSTYHKCNTNTNSDCLGMAETRACEVSLE